MIVLSVVCFGIAVLMHLFGWGSGKIDVELFMLLGMLFLALAALPLPGWPWRRPPS